MLLKKRLRKVMDWRKVGKTAYLQAKEHSPTDDFGVRILSGAQPHRCYGRSRRHLHGYRTVLFLRGVQEKAKKLYGGGR